MAPREKSAGPLCYNAHMGRLFTYILIQSAGFFAKYKKRLPALALVAGFVWDYFLFQRPDEPLENILIIAHLVVAAGAIILLSMRGRETVIWRIPLVLLAQFNFGALAKSLLVLYVKSGTWEGSALFFILFGALILINEFSSGRFAELRAHVVSLYVFTLLYAALIVPVLLGEIGVQAFVLSCVVAAVVMTAFLAIIRLVTPSVISGKISTIYTSMVGITAVFAALYTFNVIPPVPIALQSAGIYHNIVRDNDTYTVTYELPAWYMFWRQTADTYHVQDGEPGYCFSSIIAPDNFSTPVYHTWERYDEHLSVWQEEARIAYAISGGRRGGYRGYTIKSSLEPGVWRCNIETERGALIGRVSFTVAFGTPELQTDKF